MFNNFNKKNDDSKTLEMLFESTLIEIKKTPKSIQLQVAQNVLNDLMKYCGENANINPDLVLVLHEHYKKMRQDAINHGAVSDRDPSYAYPALLESIFMTMPRDAALANQMSMKIGALCQELGMG